MLNRAESLIAADARERVTAGTLEGDIRGGSCSPHPDTAVRRAAERDPDTPAGRYDCVAYTSRLQAGGRGRTALFGYPYWLVIDYDDSEAAWCLATRHTGEAGSSLATVPVPEPCRDPSGAG